MSHKTSFEVYVMLCYYVIIEHDNLVFASETLNNNLQCNNYIQLIFILYYNNYIIYLVHFQ